MGSAKTHLGLRYERECCGCGECCGFLCFSAYRSVVAQKIRSRPWRVAPRRFLCCCLNDVADGMSPCGEAWGRKAPIRSERFSLYTVAFGAYRALSGYFVGMFVCISIYEVSSSLFLQLIL
jgi:hypothetical protein